MAEGGDDRDTEDLLDDPSQSKIDELREKGQVAQSRELTAVLVFLATASSLYAFAPGMVRDVMAYMRETFETTQYTKVDFTQGNFIGESLLKALKLMVLVSLPVAASGFVVGILASFVQVGSVFTVEPIQPNFEKIDPIKGFFRVFSMRTIWEGVRLVVKMTIAVAIAVSIVKAEIYIAPMRMFSDPKSLISAFGESSKSVFFGLSAIFLVFAAVDWWMQRREWLKQVRLTKQEAKEEAKERDGNPQMKARVKSVQREMSRKRMMSAIKTADVIVTNPTHIAIAIQYDREKMAAPKVVAKGADLIAMRIREIAKEAGIPIVENVPLARTLFKSVKLNQAVPRALYQAVAEVLAYVYRLRGKL